MKASKTILTVIYLLATANAGMAATYSVNGTITSSDFSSLPATTPFTITFDYHPSTAGSDLNSDSTVGFYLDAVTNGSISFGGSPQTLGLNGVIVTDQPTSTGSGDSFAPQIGSFPDVEGQSFSFGEFRFSDGETRWTTDALPADDLAGSPWTSGSLTMTFGDFMSESEITGSLDMGSLQSIPEPSGTLIVALGGMLAILTRRRH